VLEVHADVINMEMPLHDKPIQGVQHRIAEAITRTCFAAASKIIVVSKPLGTRLQTYWNVPADKIVTLPNAVDLELFTAGTEKDTTRARLGLGDAPVIIFTGSFQPWHGVETLIQAFTRVVTEVPDARLLLVGDGRLRKKLEADVQTAGLANNVIFTGSVAHQAIPDLVNIADVAVAPYTQAETELWFSPLKLFEYMALGKAVVASNVGQIAEVIQDGHSGMLVEPGNASQLGITLVTLLQDAGLRRKLGDRARRITTEQHSWTSRAHKLEQAFRAALAEHAQTGRRSLPTS
jgi:glycosyltransferase involved in cell wall biosynthesis